MWAEEELVENQSHSASTSGPLSIPSFPKAANVWGYAGPRFQGPNRALSIKEATLNEEHIAQSEEPPFLMKSGRRIFPGDLQKAIGFITQGGAAGIKGFWLKQLARI